MRLAVAVITFVVGLAIVVGCGAAISAIGRGCGEVVKEVGKTAGPPIAAAFGKVLKQEAMKEARKQMDAVLAKELMPTFSVGLIGAAAPVGPSALSILAYDAAWRGHMNRGEESEPLFPTPLFIRQTNPPTEENRR